jgi:alcohol dehydrogenase class IV
MSARIALPRILCVGGGAFNETGELLSGLGLGAPLIVTDAFFARQGLADRLAELLRRSNISGIGIFSGSVPDPTTSSVDAGLEALKQGNFDSVIGLGGGSSIDTAKAIAVLGVHGGKMRDYKAPHQQDVPGLPIVAIPTTAGTGSEATRFTIVTDEETGEKMLCIGLSYLPTAAIVDYELTLSKPIRLTADTGVDSLTHAIEAYVSKLANPFSDGFALTAMKAIWKNLPTAYFDPQNRAAREAMMLAATQAGIAFSNSSVALVHGMSRPIGAKFHVPHGLSNAMLLPTITAFSITAAKTRYADCAKAMGIAPDDMDDDRATQTLVESLRELNHRLEVPTPSQYGIAEPDWFGSLPTMAKQALASGSPANNPRVPTAEEIEELYREIWKGGREQRAVSGKQ